LKPVTGQRPRDLTPRRSSIGTREPFHAKAHSPEVLNGISDVRAFFRTNPVPLYFISPTPFNLLGIYRWVRNFFYVTYFDSFERTHPRVLVPQRRERRDFGSMEDVCNHLLRDPETLEFIAHRGPGGEACFVMPNAETKALAHKAGLKVMHPSVSRAERLGSKIVMTRLAEEVGVPCVPHVIGRAGSYEKLLALARSAGLGDDLVVEAPYGYDGDGTFFVRGERDWDRCAGELVKHELISQSKTIA
jgi:biotin carboxylase